jgi:hypothetical protein
MATAPPDLCDCLGHSRGRIKLLRRMSLSLGATLSFGGASAAPRGSGS